MKQIYIVLLLVVSQQITAQIQITQAHMPSIGDTIRYSVSSSTSKDFTLKGANYNWNYADLNTVSQDIYRFQALLSTPYSTLAFTGMPAGAIGYKVADSIGQGQAGLKNIYNFYEKKSSGWNAVGTGFTLSALPLPAGGVYKDKDEIYIFPLKYNDQDSSTFDVVTPIGNIIVQLGTFRQFGYRINHVEGWGTISTPYGSSINCIKIKSRIVETDSLKITTPSINVGFQSNRVEYRWLSTSEKIPVLEVVGIETGGNFTPNSIRFRDNYRVPGPSALAPRPLFDCNRYIGKAGKDTFVFSNQTFPSIGSIYQWSFSPNKGIRYVGTDASSKNPTVLFDSSGVFSVTLKASNLAGSRDSTASNMISISKDNTQNVSIQQLNTDIVYPNPCKDQIHFKSPEFAGKLCRVFDISGREVYQSRINENLTLSLPVLGHGIYTVLIAESGTLFYTQINIQ